MWIADNWKDFEVLDASGGERLERWGKYILVRPDPQVIWNTPRTHKGWNAVNGHYHRSSKGGGEWEIFDLPDEWRITYPLISAERHTQDSAEKHTQDRPAKGGAMPGAAGGALVFNLKPFSFKHTGLFPEQAANWEWFSLLIREALKRNPRRQPKILNLFAYTGGATIAAAAAGAGVTHVDASKGIVGWAKENAAASGLSEAPIRFLVDDCVKFVEREIRRGNHYDGIIMDPPSYGRGPKGEIWKLEENIWPLIGLTAQLLSKDALFFLINAYTTGLQPAVLSYMLNAAIAKNFGGRVEAGEIGLPVASGGQPSALSGQPTSLSGQPSVSGGLVLPCGASGRWFQGPIHRT